MHCGYTEYEIGETTFLFYKDIIEEIAIQLNYNSVVHLLSRDYADEEVLKFVDTCNPLKLDLNETSNKNSNKNSPKVTMKSLKNTGLI